MTIETLISKYGIRPTGDGNLRLTHNPTPDDLSFLKAHKPEILAHLEAERLEREAAGKARQAKIDAIEGLRELRAAISAERDYQEAFSRAIHSGNPRMPRKPEISSADIKSQYPRAAAYIEAENYSVASNYAKMAAGNKALERIIEDEDHEIVLADMEAEWTAHCNAHIWD